MTTPPADRRRGRGADPPLREIEEFASLVRARRIGDIKTSMDHIRALRALGWSVAATEPREGRRPGR